MYCGGDEGRRRALHPPSEKATSFGLEPPVGAGSVSRHLRGDARTAAHEVGTQPHSTGRRDLLGQELTIKGPGPSYIYL